MGEFFFGVKCSSRFWFLGLGCSGPVSMMKLSYWNCCFLVLILVAQAVTLTRTEDEPACDPRCVTQDCDSEGNCVCVGHTAGLTSFHG